MKKITAATYVLDNLGNYQAPGAELIVSEDEREGHIHPDVAKLLTDQAAQRAKLPVAPAPAADAGEPAAE